MDPISVAVGDELICGVFLLRHIEPLVLTRAHSEGNPRVIVELEQPLRLCIEGEFPVIDPDKGLSGWSNWGYVFHRCHHCKNTCVWLYYGLFLLNPHTAEPGIVLSLLRI